MRGVRIRHGRYQARISVGAHGRGGGYISLGYYETEHEAALAYDIASLRMDSTRSHSWPRNFPYKTLNELEAEFKALRG